MASYEGDLVTHNLLMRTGIVGSEITITGTMGSNSWPIPVGRLPKILVVAQLGTTTTTTGSIVISYSGSVGPSPFLSAGTLSMTIAQDAITKQYVATGWISSFDYSTLLITQLISHASISLANINVYLTGMLGKF